MSSIGSGSPIGTNLAGSFAGAQRTTGQQDETKAAQAAQKFQAEQSAAIDKDVAEADMDADRDADGRQSLAAAFDEGATEEETDASSGTSGTGTVKHAPDAFGERGSKLDLDA